MMTNKEMQKTVELLCDGEIVRFGRYLIKAQEIKEGEAPCAICAVHKICTITFAEMCLKCDAKTQAAHYFEIVG